MPAFLITVSVATHRDPESNPYTYAEIHRVPISEFTNLKTSKLIREAHTNFRATLPHKYTPGHFLPTDVVVREVD